MDIAATVSNLIKNLLPNDDGRWVSSRWISDELSPLLSSMRAKDLQTARLAVTNAETGNTFAILLAVLFTLMVMTTIIGFFCYRHSGKIASRVTDGLNFILGEMGTRAPNRLPSFSV